MAEIARLVPATRSQRAMLYNLYPNWAKHICRSQKATTACPACDHDMSIICAALPSPARLPRLLPERDRPAEPDRMEPADDDRDTQPLVGMLRGGVRNAASLRSAVGMRGGVPGSRGNLTGEETTPFRMGEGAKTLEISREMARFTALGLVELIAA